MLMKMKCVDAYKNLKDLVNVFNSSDTKYPASLIICASRNKEKLIEELKEYEQKLIQTIKEVGESDETGGYFVPDNKEAQEKFSDLMRDYNDTEIEIQIQTVKMEKFDNMNYTAKEIEPFMFMIEE